MSTHGLIARRNSLPIETPLRPIRVLLVDDDEDWYAFTKELLVASDHLACEVDWQASFTSALRVMARRQHDVYLVDYRLADGDGLTLLREAHRRGCTAPMILLTGQGDDAVERAAIVAGAADYVDKYRADVYVLTRAIAEAIERNQLLKALRASEARYRSLFEESLDPIYISSRDGKLLEMNAAAVDLFGGSRKELIGLNMEAIYADPSQRQKFQDDIERDGAVRDYELRLRRRDGTVRTCSITASVHRDLEGQVVGYQGIVRDITERQRLEEALRQAQKMDALGRLAGGVAHDFNNMLTAILGCADMMLLQIGSDKPISTDILDIYHAADRAAGLTRQLLAFSRKQVVRFVAIDVNSVVREASNLLGRTLHEDIRLTMALAPNLRPIRADASQLEQVLMNLAINAQDAMPRGGTLTIETANVDLTDASTHAELKPGRYVRLTVSDTGDGMDAETRTRLFEPFFTTKGEGRGTGLGLATVYGIVRQCGGTIWVYSEIGHGTTFKLYFPETDSTVDAPAEPTTVSPVELVGTETVWLVEDDATVRAFATRVLKRFGYHVYEAATPHDALRHAGEYDGPIHLLLTDVVMPELNGCDLASWFGATHPETRILYMSGYTDEAMESHGWSAGMKNLLEKPFTSTELLRKVRGVFDGS